MESSLPISRDYEIFGMIAKNAGAIEAVSKKLASMETCENMENFARKIAADWKKSDNNVTSLKLAFSDFEKILESKRSEINSHLGNLRNKRKMRHTKHLIQDSTAL